MQYFQSLKGLEECQTAGNGFPGSVVCPVGLNMFQEQKEAVRPPVEVKELVFVPVDHLSTTRTYPAN